MLPLQPELSFGVGAKNILAFESIGWNYLVLAKGLSFGARKTNLNLGSKIYYLYEFQQSV